MYASILQHTPLWVWGALAALVVSGAAQSRPRRRSIRSATLLPFLMTGLSLHGVASDFAHQPLALAAWVIGNAALLALATLGGAWRGVRSSPEYASLIVPGSWLPLTLYLGLFGVKFVANVALALHPARIEDPHFVGMTCLAYGAFSGVFLARSLAMWRIARDVPVREATSP